MKALIFDLDGTLYQTEIVAVPAFQKTFEWLQDKGWYTGSLPTAKEIESVFGMTGEVFWRRLLPEADDQVRKIADQKLLSYELDLIRQGSGKFYPGVVNGLHQLREEGWELFIASNGLHDYVQAVLDSADLTSLFTDLYTLGDHPSETKKEAVNRCIDHYHIRKGYMVGDRSSDMEAGNGNRLTTIGCKYAGYPYFGKEEELVEADYLIDRFQSLFTHIK